MADITPLDARWTIRNEVGFGNYINGPMTVGWVPVVACDDAAIERAATVLADMWPNDFDPARRGLFNVHAKQVAEAVLRAAGAPDAA